MTLFVRGYTVRLCSAHHDLEESIFASNSSVHVPLPGNFLLSVGCEEKRWPYIPDKLHFLHRIATSKLF